MDNQEKEVCYIAAPLLSRILNDPKVISQLQSTKSIRDWRVILRREVNKRNK